MTPLFDNPCPWLRNVRRYQLLKVINAQNKSDDSLNTTFNLAG
jgi:hypothetical protein